jgi:glycosyltransferase involved in cell wall biosynthesis
VKVLISAYACAPDRGSEPSIGWNVATQVARHHDTWVLTSTENEASIRDAMRTSNATPNMKVSFVEPFGWTVDLATRRRPIPVAANLHYYAWQAIAYARAKSLHRRIRFDVVHHVTFGRYYTPSLLSLLPAPFVWGPLGGGESAPVSFWPGFGLQGIAYEAARAVARSVGEHDPLVRITARRSTIAKATTPETAARLRRLGAHTDGVLPAVGVPLAVPRAASGRAPGRDRYFLTISRLLPWKGVHLSLRAFARARPDGVMFRIVGWGPERPRLERLVRKLGLGDRVEFTGEVSRADVQSLLDDCLALVHPSLHDSGGSACLEAMAAGKAVVCLDAGGPATMVTGDTGFVIPPLSPGRAIAGLADALRVLANNDALRTRLGENGRRRVEDMFTWEARGRILSQLYEYAVRAADGGR